MLLDIWQPAVILLIFNRKMHICTSSAFKINNMTQNAILLLSLFTPYWFLGFYICAKMARKSFVKKCIKNPVIWHAENLPSVFLANTSGTYRYSLLFRPMGARTHTHHSRITSMTPHFPPRTIFFSRDFYATF